MSCAHPTARLYKHGTLAVCPLCSLRNERIKHHEDGTWTAIGPWAAPKKPFKETGWTMREHRALSKRLAKA